MLDYDIKIGLDELKTLNDRSGYADNIDTYVDKMLRFVVSNLPNTYNIKTTRDSIKILLLSFGIMGNVIEYYTNDYKDSWVANNFTSGSYVADDIDSTYYPTPHISIGVDIANTDKSVTLSTNDTIQKALLAVESIRPTNVVLDGIIGYASDIKLPDITISLKFCSTKVIAIGRENQQSPYKA